MIPIVKGHEPSVLTEAKRIIRSTPDATFCYDRFEESLSVRFLRRWLSNRGIFVPTVCAGSVRMDIRLRSSI